MGKISIWPIVMASIFFSLSSNSWGAKKEAWYCAGFMRAIINKLPSTVEKQRVVTSPVPMEKTIPGDLIFFGKIGERWGCPNGFSGMVMSVGKGFIVFVVPVAVPKEQVLLFPIKTYKGNTWYRLHPQIRTFEPETDPPRPGDKNYKPMQHDYR